MNKFIVSTFLGSTYAAAGPLPGDELPNWPAYKATYTLATGDKTAGGAYNVSFSTANTVSIGPYRGFRIGLIVFPTQKVVKAGASAAGSVAA